jgi:hypothetical protein
MELLVYDPTASWFVLKYIPKTHKFILKVTNGEHIVMKKCRAEVGVRLCRNSTRSKSSPFWPEGPSPMRQSRRWRRPSRTERKATRRRRLRRKTNDRSINCHQSLLREKRRAE